MSKAEKDCIVELGVCFSIDSRTGAVGMALWAESPALVFTLRTFPEKLCLFHLSHRIGSGTKGRSLTPRGKCSNHPHDLVLSTVI